MPCPMNWKTNDKSVLDCLKLLSSPNNENLNDFSEFSLIFLCSRGLKTWQMIWYRLIFFVT